MNPLHLPWQKHPSGTIYDAKGDIIAQGCEDEDADIIIARVGAYEELVEACKEGARILEQISTETSDHLTIGPARHFADKLRAALRKCGG